MNGWRFCMTLACLILAWSSMGTAQAGEPGMRSPVVVGRRPDAFGEAYAGALARYREGSRRYNGLAIEVAPDVHGELIRGWGEVADLLEWLDFVPDERLQRFRWIEEEMDATITGWDARLIAMEQVPGAMLLDLQVYPRHDTNVGFAARGDYLIERYLVIGGMVHYLGSKAPAMRGVVVFN